MTEKIHAHRETHQGFSPVLCVKNAAEALAFYTRAFGATEEYRLLMTDGSVGHAQFHIGDARFMINDEFPQWGARSAQTLGGSPVTLHLYVKDVDTFCAKAVKAGLKVIMPVSDEFYGDRVGKFEDPFGLVWMIATHTKDVSIEEMQAYCDKIPMSPPK